MTSVMTNFTVLYDACILYSASLRNLFMYLAGTGLFRAKWTNEIHEEWIRNLLLNKPDLTRPALEKIRNLMNDHVLDALVVGYEALAPALSLPDANDAHVLAAAIQAKADVIVTFNLKDCPDEELKKYGIEAQHPDEFVRHLIDLSLPTTLEAVKALRESLKNPPYSAEKLLQVWHAQGLPMTVEALRPYSNFI